MSKRYRLRRRGVDHGRISPGPRATSWERGEPVVLRGAVRPPDVSKAVRVLKALRAGGDPARLLDAPDGFAWTGVTQNVADRLEIAKLHVQPADLYIKVNWLSEVPGDASLRLRFSYGTEILDDWVDDPMRGMLVENLIEGLFPECRPTRRLFNRLAPLIGKYWRPIQPILYANAPGGGALFHHDYVPGQDGVLFTQFAGSTAWLAVPGPVLRRHIEEHSKRPIPGLARRLDRRDRAIERLLNDTPAFTRRLAADGWLFVLRPGDALLLPMATEADATWHSVFTLGRGPNWALSSGFVLNG